MIRSIKNISRQWQKLRYQRRLSHSPVRPVQPERPVIVFATEGGVRSHHETLRHIAQKLRSSGTPVLVARCSGCFSMCPTLSMHRSMANEAGYDGPRICEKCAIDAWRLSDGDGLDSFDLRSFLDHEVKRIVDEAASTLDLSPHKFVYGDVSFGKLCAVDFALMTKQSEIGDLSPQHAAIMHDLIKTSLTAYLLVDRLCAALQPRALVYHNDYAMHLSVRLAAEKHDVPVTGVTMAYHRNIDREKIVFFPKCFAAFAVSVKDYWPAWRNLPLPRDKITATMDDLIFRIGGRGSHIYSPPIMDSDELIEQLKIDTSRKLIAAFTSSLDELVGMQVMLESVGYKGPAVNQPFRDQIEWLTHLVGWAEARHDIQLIVRVHPREGRNHRDSKESDHLRQLRAKFAKLPRNCIFVWPEDNLSSYGIGELSDFFDETERY